MFSGKIEGRLKKALQDGTPVELKLKKPTFISFDYDGLDSLRGVPVHEFVVVIFNEYESTTVVFLRPENPNSLSERALRDDGLVQIDLQDVTAVEFV